MSLSLSQFAQQLKSYSGPVVGPDGRFTGDILALLSQAIDTSGAVAETAQSAADDAQASANTAQAAASTAQTAADNASQSSTVGVGAQWFWNSDTAGNWPVGDPTADLTATFEDKTGTVVATRVLRGTLTSATGLIAITAVSATGLTTTYSVNSNNTNSPSAKVTVTLEDGSKIVAGLTWGAIDLSAAGALDFEFS